MVTMAIFRPQGSLETTGDSIRRVELLGITVEARDCSQGLEQVGTCVISRLGELNEWNVEVVVKSKVE